MDEIKNKYGIELIGKGMWVWDDDISKAKLKMSVTGKTTNASDTNPNYKEPKVGDKGFFWDDETYYAYDVITSIINTNGVKDLRAFNAHFSGNYKHFSHEKQPWMK